MISSPDLKVSVMTSFARHSRKKRLQAKKYFSIFPGYFDRVIAKGGGGGDRDGSRSGSRKCSISSQPSFSESDSRPTTAG